MSTRKGLLAVFLLLAAATAEAQVPVGHGARFSESPVGGGSSGIHVVDFENGVVTFVSGLSLTASDAFAGRIDPVTGRLLIAGREPTPGAGARLLSIGLQGTAVRDEVEISDTGVAILWDVAFTRDGDVVAVDDHQLLWIDRQTGAVTVWDAVPPGSPRAVEVDRETNRCWVVASSLIEHVPSTVLRYELDLGPGPGTAVGSVVLEQVGGIAYDGANTLYLAGGNFGVETRDVLAFDLPTGQSQVIFADPSGLLDSLHRDRRTGLLHGASISSPGPNEWNVLDPATFAATVAATFVGEYWVPRGCAVNDLIDLTEVFPRRPSAAAATTIEMAAHGLPGELAFLAVTEVSGAPIAPLILGSGPVDAGGFFALTLDVPAGALSTGQQLTIGSARLDLFSGAITLGTEAAVEVVP